MTTTEKHNKDLKKEILTAANAGELEEKEEDVDPDEAAQQSIDNRLNRNQNKKS